uniref:L1 transposable element RRM domain-containing protein n=1 Tax=Sus scrofa TaxID=9823 RepID=A0A8D1N251_PIG
MKILKELRRTIGRNVDYGKNSNRNYKDEPGNVENSFAEMKAKIKAINSKLNNAEKQVIDQEDRITEITQSAHQMERQMKKKNESNKRDLWDNIKCDNLHIIGIPKGDERRKEFNNVFEEMMAENLPNLKKGTDIQVQEIQRVPSKMNPNRSIPRHIITKMAKVKYYESNL